ncbi:MAG TPA: AI-2E family transporter [Pseudomonadales bacterium]|nr:AI-2E family transporter [Pseudomonadales bacterium]
MTDSIKVTRSANIMVTIAALMIVIAAMRAAADIVVPFLLAAFIATIAATPLLWLQRRGAPTAVALIAVIGLIIIGGGALGALIGSSVNDFTDAVPFYEERLRALGDQGLAVLADYGIEVSRDIVAGYFDPGFAMRMVGRTMSGLGGVLSNTFLILLTVIFILLEASSFPRKLRDVLADPAATLPRFRSFAETMNRYMAIKTTISLATGGLVWLLNTLLGVDFAVLWAVLAFLLNYVPNIGSIIAAIPAVLLATVQIGITESLLLAAGYFGINTLMGNAIEPRFMGRGLGLSTLVVWLSLVFWGWALGPVGMLLSVPLTVTLRIALESQPSTHWIAVLLGPEDELPTAASPDEGEVAQADGAAEADTDDDARTAHGREGDLPADRA